MLLTSDGIAVELRLPAALSSLSLDFNARALSSSDSMEFVSGVQVPSLPVRVSLARPSSAYAMADVPFVRDEMSGFPALEGGSDNVGIAIVACI